MNQPRTLPEPPQPELVVESFRLSELASSWKGCSAIALDTEFVRTRTYYPKLGLIQVGDPVGLYLIDVVEIENLQPLFDVLLDPGIVKVFHSPSEDLEVFLHLFGGVPEPLFDTQIAATMAGYGGSLSYQRLVGALFDIDVAKGEQRSNWVRRPLSAEQIEYASLDVAYLLPAHELLEQKLLDLERVPWLEEELSALVAESRSRLDPERIVARLERRSMSPIQAATLRSLVQWREKKAMERDLPRNFVLRDEALVEIARRRPRSRDSFRSIAGLGPKERQRYGQKLLSIVRSARVKAQPEEGGRPSPGSTRGGTSRRRVAALREVLEEVAEQLVLPPELLARRRWLEELVRRVRDGNRELPEGLRGWREPVIGRPLLERCLED